MSKTYEEIQARDAGQCRWVQERLHAFVEGEAAPLLVKLVSEHLSACSPCAAALSALQNERIELIESLVEAPRLPGDFAARVSRRIDRAERATLRRQRQTFFWRLGAMAAAAFVLSFFSASLFRPRPESEPTAPLAVARAGVESAVATASTPREERAPQVLPELPEKRLVGDVSQPVFATFATLATPRVRSFGHVLDMAHRIAPDARKLESQLRDDPCKPDPNRDGRTDITDVAYSCQVLLAGQRVLSPSYAMDHAPALDPTSGKTTEAVDCDESCSRA